MKPNQTTSIIAALGPLAVLSSPVVIAAAAGLGLIWMLSRDDDKNPTQSAEGQTAATSGSGGRTVRPGNYPGSRSIMMEDLEDVFQSGERGLTRSEAVAELRAKGFGKTAAYKALSATGHFADCFYEAPDGVIIWEG